MVWYWCSFGFLFAVRTDHTRKGEFDMKKNKLNPVVIWTNIISVLFLAALIAVLFLPAWDYRDGTLSIAEYLAFPTKKISLLKGFRETLGLDKIPGVNDVVTVPVMTMLLAIAGAVATWVFKKLPLGSVAAVVTGAWALITYLTVPFFTLAYSHLYLVIAAAAALVAGLACLTIAIISIVKEEKKILTEK